MNLKEKRVEMGRRIPKGIQKTQGQDHKSTGTCSPEERRKI